MTNALCSSRLLFPLALSVVITLAIGHATDLGIQMLGSGLASTPALVGDLAGLAACATFAWYGLRQIARSPGC